MLACEIVGIEMFSQRLMRLRQAATTDDSAANATNAIIIYVNITQISRSQAATPPTAAYVAAILALAAQCRLHDHYRHRHHHQRHQ